MELLKSIQDYNVLLDLALQLQRTPEPDKLEFFLINKMNFY